MFGVDQETEKPTIERHLSREEQTQLRGIARLKARRMEREELQARKQERETSRPRKHELEREASIWDALDGIGCEQNSTRDQSETSGAMTRIQERASERQHERETEEAERQRLEREKQEREQERDIGFGYGF